MGSRDFTCAKKAIGKNLLPVFIRFFSILRRLNRMDHKEEIITVLTILSLISKLSKSLWDNYQDDINDMLYRLDHEIKGVNDDFF
jgi:hypothetical protein